MPLLVSAFTWWLATKYLHESIQFIFHRRVQYAKRSSCWLMSSEGTQPNFQPSWSSPTPCKTRTCGQNSLAKVCSYSGRIWLNNFNRWCCIDVERQMMLRWFLIISLEVMKCHPIFSIHSGDQWLGSSSRLQSLTFNSHISQPRRTEQIAAANNLNQILRPISFYHHTVSWSWRTQFGWR